jgi:hypothetical protein
MNVFRLSARLLVLVVCACLALGSASAQTKKKKRTARKKPAVSKTVSQTNGDASVVSLADQYQDSSTQIIQPTQSLADTQPPVLSDETTKKLKDLQSRIKKLENPQAANTKNTYEEKQKVLLINLDILTKAEQRSESIRKQRFELIEKENTIRTRMDQIDVESRPEVIERSVATIGSLRPEELREAKRKSLDAEKRNLQNLLSEVISTRSRLDGDLVKSDALVEKLRNKLEQDIDAALTDDPDQ